MPALPQKLNLGKVERLIYVLFFLSGFPALFYQITWQRALFRIFGVNDESVTVVVTAFMLGLGFGSLAGGLVSKFKKLHLLLVVALIECGIGLFGIASLSIFESLGQMVLGLPLAVTALAVLGLIFIPTLLMGATLPILVSHFAPRLGNMGASVGSLYYVNTLGAGAACLVAVIVLFPFGGMTSAVYTAAAINISIGLCALSAYFLFRKGGKLNLGMSILRRVLSKARRKPLIGFYAVLFLSALEGFISLSYEIFFFRIVAFMTASSAIAFPITLGTFLIGLASGAGDAGRLSRTMSHKDLVDKILKSLATALLIGFLFLPVLNLLGELDSLFLAGMVRPILFLLIAIILMIFFMTKSWGIVLPGLTELAIRPDDKSGMRASLVYVSNILGSAVGATLTGFFLTNWLSMPDLASGFVMIGIVYFILFFLLSGKKLKQNRKAMAAFAVVLIVCIPFVQRLMTPDLLENIQWQRIAHAKLAEIVENRHGIISIDTNQVIYGNGVYDGHFSTDLVHDNNGIIRPYALSLLHPAPHDVLMIGLSSGSWAQVVANNPDVNHLTIVEINPGYLGLIRERPQVASLLTNPKVDIVIDDGRRWLNLHPERRFDAIINNATFHFRSNTTNLLSREFLGLAARHLKKGGILYYNTTNSTRVQRTACLTYPFGLRFANHMAISNEPIRLDFSHWKDVLENYRIDDKPIIDDAHDNDRRVLVALMKLRDDPKALNGIYKLDKSVTFTESCGDILARTQDLVPITDDNMGTEWRYPFFGDY